MKRIIIIFLTVFFTTNVFAYKTTTFYGVENPNIISEETLKEQVKYGDYEVKIYRGDESGEGVVQIFKNEEVIFEEQGHQFYTFDESYINDKYKYEIGKDLTGDGNSNLVFMHWSGGAHCCYDTYLFSMEDDLKFIDKFEGEHSTPVFEDINHDGVYEVSLNDWAFAYWNECFAMSPAPEVILKYENDRYHVANDLMSKSIDEVNNKFDFNYYKDNRLNGCEEGSFAWRGKDACINADVWSYMLALIYAGQPDAAWKYLDDTWKFSQEDKKAFISDFKSQLALSDYSEGLTVDLASYEPEIVDASDKAYLRFKTHYDAMLNTMNETNPEKVGIKSVPTLNTIFSEEVLGDLLGWYGR